MSDVQTVGLVIGGLVLLVVVLRLIKLLLGAAAGLVVSIPIVVFHAVILGFAWLGALLFALAVSVWAWCRAGIERLRARRVGRREARARLRGTDASGVGS